MGGIRDLQGQRVLLTGAAGAIGSRLAHRLLDGGCELVLVDRRGAELERLATDLRGRSRDARAVTLRVDLSVPEEREGLADATADRPPTVLINNAGLAPGASFATMDAAEIQQVLAVNLVAVVDLTRRVLPQMLAAGRGQIVNIASAAGLAAPAGLVAYAASKFGLVGFSEALRAELHGTGVGVSVICPAFVRSDIVRNSAVGVGAQEQQRLERLDRFVKRRGIDPDRVARAVVQAIRHDRARVVLGAPYRALVALRFLSPALADWINQQNYARLKRRGLL